MNVPDALSYVPSNRPFHKWCDIFAAYETLPLCRKGHLWLKSPNSLPDNSRFFVEVITVVSWGDNADPNIDLILPSCPWHLNWSPGREEINKDDTRGGAVRSGPFFWKGFKSSARSRWKATVASAISDHIVPCQKCCDNHGPYLISVLYIWTLWTIQIANQSVAQRKLSWIFAKQNIMILRKITSERL